MRFGAAWLDGKQRLDVRHRSLRLVKLRRVELDEPRAQLTFVLRLRRRVGEERLLEQPRDVA